MVRGPLVSIKRREGRYSFRLLAGSTDSVSGAFSLLLGVLCACIVLHCAGMWMLFSCNLHPFCVLCPGLLFSFGLRFCKECCGLLLCDLLGRGNQNVLATVTVGMNSRCLCLSVISMRSQTETKSSYRSAEIRKRMIKTSNSPTSIVSPETCSHRPTIYRGHPKPLTKLTPSPRPKNSPHAPYP